MMMYNSGDNYILLVDDDREFLKIYSQIFELNSFRVLTASDGLEALELIRTNWVSVVVSDVIMPKMDGITLLQRMKAYKREIQIIMLTGEGSIPGAVEAVREGAFTYMVKPVDVEDLILTIRKAKELYEVQQENITLKRQVAELREGMPLIGESAAIEQIRQVTSLIASTDSTVLITGESGTGKEIAANLIYSKSRRAGKPFVKVNCAALAEGVLESELFGHERGSFTGAFRERQGRFEAANKGTILLDEIGELSVGLQAKLLRVLQEKEFERVGGTTTIKADFHLIASTNKNLEEAVRLGNFRSDLYYRINVIPISLPPLRERKGDIPLLVKFFLKQYMEEMKRVIEPPSPEIMERFEAYSWPGNVRELKNIIERLVVFAADGRIRLSSLPPEIAAAGTGGTQSGRLDPVSEEEKGTASGRQEGSSVQSGTLTEARQQFEKEYIRKALEKNRGNITATASELGLARKNVYKKISDYQIDQ